MTDGIAAGLVFFGVPVRGNRLVLLESSWSGGAPGCSMLVVTGSFVQDATEPCDVEKSGVSDTLLE